jgi:DNA-binding CsgD family transcriptional regulator
MKNIKEFNSRKDWINFTWSTILADVKNPQFANMLNVLISAHEKENIVNRLAALIFIEQGKSYKQIGEELWVSPTTIRSLKRITDNNYSKEYKSYNKLRKDNESNKIKSKNVPETPSFVNWINYYASVFPKRNGPRWKFIK